MKSDINCIDQAHIHVTELELVVHLHTIVAEKKCGELSTQLEHARAAAKNVEEMKRLDGYITLS